MKTATKLSDLKANSGNPRVITDDKLAMLKKSLAKFGDLSGIVFNRRSKQLVGGHQRIRVLPQSAVIISEVSHRKPTKIGTVAEGHVLIEGERFKYREVDWDEKTERAANIAANQHGGEFEMAKLTEWVKGLRAGGIDMDLIGFTKEEIDEKFGGVPKTVPGADEEEVPKPRPRGDIKAKIGHMWQLGEHRLLCGDSTNPKDVDRLMNGKKADMVFTDPPYGVNMTAKNELLNAHTGQASLTTGIRADDLSVDELKPIIEAAFGNISRILADKSCYYIASPQGGELGLMMMMMMQEAGIPCRHMIVWVKNAPVFSLGRLDYDYQHEPILYGWSKNRSHHKSSLKGQWTKSTWHCDREPNKLHPTMKPVALIENALLNSTKPGMIVADLFGGSGSTLIAAQKTERKARIMEIDPQYCDVIVARFEKFSGQKAKLVKR